MKTKILIGLCFIAIMQSTKIVAQENEDRNITEVFDSLTTGLIKDRIPFGVLYDRVFPWSNLNEWDNEDSIHNYKLFQAWFDLENSNVYDDLRTNTYSAMRKNTNQEINLGQIPLLVINYNYSYFDLEAFQDGRLSMVDGIITDNNLSTPYMTKNVTFGGITL